MQMTASEHLKQRLATGSLGGDQIPEDLLEPYNYLKTGTMTIRANKLVHYWSDERICSLIERIAKAEAALAQKTRECEEWENREQERIKWDNMEVVAKPEDFALVPVDALRKAHAEQFNYSRTLEKRVEQLQRQVAEMSKPVTVAELKRNGAQGMVAIYAVEAVKSLIAARAART